MVTPDPGTPARDVEPPPGPAPGGEGAAFRLADLLLEDLASERLGDRRILRWAIVAAVLFHVGLLAVTFPDITATPREYERPKRVYFVNQTRFRPPPPPTGQQPPPKRRAKKVPIPDPTPLDPEPIVVPEIELPEIDLPEFDIDAFGIPGPPTDSRTGTGSGEGPFYVGGGISPPVKVYAPLPPYTEAARLARIEGTVILECVIDREGNVTQVSVLKGLPHGLAESAVETARQWKFEPARRDGEPVPVFFALSVNFHLQ